MPYTKIIRYKNNFELYEYEREPFDFGGRRGQRKNNTHNKNISADGENTRREKQAWKRKDNVRRVKLVFRRLVASNLSGTELPLLITLTYAENITDLSIGYKDYRAFIQTLRNKYGKTFRYICVPEFQQRGAVHFHALFWGLPPEVFTQERTTRTIARIWTRGFIFMKQTDGNEKLSSYLAKYMAKAFVDSRLNNQKAYTTSRNIDRPRIDSSSTFNFGVLVDEYTQDIQPLKDQEYETLRLGKCRYRHWKTPDS